MNDTERRARPDAERARAVESGDDAPLIRWSRRKLEARRGESEPIPVPVSDEPSPRELTDVDMPALETLDENADVSMFFSRKVSPELRRLALRKLFRSSKFNICDGLDDYDGDYTQFAALGETVTADMRHMMEVAARHTRDSAETGPETGSEEGIDEATGDTPSDADEEGYQDE